MLKGELGTASQNSVLTASSLPLLLDDPSAGVVAYMCISYAVDLRTGRKGLVMARGVFPLDRGNYGARSRLCHTKPNLPRARGHGRNR